VCVISAHVPLTPSSRAERALRARMGRAAICRLQPAAIGLKIFVVMFVFDQMSSKVLRHLKY
jgi:hypothetical protein